MTVGSIEDQNKVKEEFAGQFRDLNSYSDGLAPAKKDGKWGFIDKTGQFVIAPIFELSRNFSEGLALVKYDRLYGYIDKNGDFVINPQYPSAGDFSENVAKESIVSNGKTQTPTVNVSPALSGKWENKKLK